MRLYCLSIIFSLLTFIPTTHALMLEKLIQSQMLEAILENSRIGFYVGSFDPFHKGHEGVVQDCLQKDLCDYIIIYPAWGGDSYKKRADIEDRHDMVIALYENHPRVIVTRLAPQDFQKSLTVLTTERNKKGQRFVQPRYIGSSFIGLVGSDTALALGKNEKALRLFMTGVEVSEQYKAHTLGGLMALPVETFIVSERADDDLSSLKGFIGNRKIIALFKNPFQSSNSSTQVKQQLNTGKPIHGLNHQVMKIIEEKGLYKQSRSQT